MDMGISSVSAPPSPHSAPATAMPSCTIWQTGEGWQWVILYRAGSLPWKAVACVPSHHCVSGVSHPIVMSHVLSPHHVSGVPHPTITSSSCLSIVPCWSSCWMLRGGHCHERQGAVHDVAAITRSWPLLVQGGHSGMALAGRVQCLPGDWWGLVGFRCSGCGGLLVHCSQHFNNAVVGAHHGQMVYTHRLLISGMTQKSSVVSSNCWATKSRGLPKAQSRLEKYATNIIALDMGTPRA